MQCESLALELYLGGSIHPYRRLGDVTTKRRATKVAVFLFFTIAIGNDRGKLDHLSENEPSQLRLNCTVRLFLPWFCRRQGGHVRYDNGLI